MNGIDILLLIILLACVLRGFVRGVWPEILDLAVWLASVTLSVLLVRTPAEWLSRTARIPASLAVLIGFFVLHGIFKGLLRWGVHFVFERGKTPFGQRLAGIAAGLVRGIFAAGIFAFLVLQFTALRTPNWRKEKSVLIHPVSRVAPALYYAYTAVVPPSRPVFGQMKEGFIWCARRVEDWGGPRLEPGPEPGGDDERTGS
jgi:uncharacterized membrane protein required for colicin V production